jgi:hypothetical protein
MSREKGEKCHGKMRKVSGEEGGKALREEGEKCQFLKEAEGGYAFRTNLDPCMRTLTGSMQDVHSLYSTWYRVQGEGERTHAARECKARSVLSKFKEMEQKVANGEEIDDPLCEYYVFILLDPLPSC